MDENTLKQATEILENKYKHVAVLDGRTGEGKLKSGLIHSIKTLKDLAQSVVEQNAKAPYKPSRFVLPESKEVVRGLFRKFLSFDKRQSKVTIELSQEEANKIMRALGDVLYFIDSDN